MIISNGKGRGSHGERDSSERVTTGEVRWPLGMGRRVAGCRVEGSQLPLIY